MLVKFQLLFSLPDCSLVSLGLKLSDIAYDSAIFLAKDEIALLKEESEMPFDDLISQLPKDLIENIDKPFVLSEDEQVL